MRKTNEGRSPTGILLPAAVAGLMLTLVLMLCGAWLVRRGTLDEGLITLCAFVFLALGCAAAALIAARRAAGRKLLWALGAGLVVFLVLLAAGAVLLGSRLHIVRAAVSLLCALAASAFGGLVGVNIRKSKRYNHVKR